MILFSIIIYRAKEIGIILLACLIGLWLAGFVGLLYVSNEFLYKLQVLFAPV